MKPPPPPSSFSDLRAFIQFLEQRQLLLRIHTPVEQQFEIAAICQQVLQHGGPALLFTQVKNSSLPIIANLFGTSERVALGMGRSLLELEKLGELLSRLRQPDPPSGVTGAFAFMQDIAQVRHMPVRWVRNPPCQEIIYEHDQINLDLLPIATCWPQDAAPLVTWPLVITRAPDGGPVNIGVYRMQKIGKNRLIMRWLPHRGGAQHARLWPHGKIPVAVAIGADPGLMLAAVTPIPETLSEYAFAGLLRQKPVEVAKGKWPFLPIPAGAEIVLEGEVDLHHLAEEGPFGDHTGYYNEVERFPIFTVQRITTRARPYYLSTHTGKPPDEPAILALALNHLFVPFLRRQFPEVANFHLPMESCSYRVAVVAIHKGYAGHALRMMVGIWGFLRQFLYTKFIIVVDAEVNIGDWNAVMQAIANHFRGQCDMQRLVRTPIDYLDFASPVAGLGGKMGLDATSKNSTEWYGIARPTEPLATPDSTDWQNLSHYLGFPLWPKCDGKIIVLHADKQSLSPGDVDQILRRLWQKINSPYLATWVILLDPEIDPTSWGEIWWAISTRSDPSRDLLFENPGQRLALDATNKMPWETDRVWGKPIQKDPTVAKQLTHFWQKETILGSFLKNT